MNGPLFSVCDDYNFLGEQTNFEEETKMSLVATEVSDN
jgi:hypothetical protein